jgi:hypothetical protein
MPRRVGASRISPRSVLPTLEKGGSTPSKKVLALRSASCGYAAIKDGWGRRNRSGLGGSACLPLCDRHRFLYSPRADFKHKNACTSTHLSGGLSRGEHVVIAPDVEQVSGGSAGGGRLAELVGAHRGVAADGGHGSRGEGCVPRAGVERMHTSRRRAGFGRGEGRGTSMARTYAPATAAACALRAAARPRKASCVAEPAPGSQPPIHATPAAGLCCGCTAAPAACVCALVQRGAPGRLPVAPSAPRRPEAAPRQAASRGVHSQLRRMGSAPGAARGVPAAEATTAVQATARSIAMGGVKTRNASTQKCRATCDAFRPF